MKSVYEILFDISFDMVAILSLSGEFMSVNPAFKQGMGWTLSNLKGKNFWDLIMPDDGNDLSSLVNNLSKGHPVIFVENKFKHFDGRIEYLRWTAYPDLESGTIVATIRNSSSTGESQDFLRHSVESSPTAMFIVSQGRISYANKLSELLFGYSQDEFIGNSIEILVPDHLQSIHKSHRKRYDKLPYLRTMGLNLELSGQNKNGDHFPVDIGLNPLNTPEGMLIICSVIDLSKQKASDSLNVEKILELEKEISVLGKLARTDELTAIHNRRALFKQLELLYRVAQKENRPLSFILLDIDNFKQYNDTYGHLNGDHVLKDVAAIISTSTRKTEFVARYGGEEFAVILPATKPDEAKALAERMRRTIESFEWSYRNISISLGISTVHPKSILDENSLDTNKLIIMADQALYFSKRNGKNMATHFNDLVVDPNDQLLEWNLKHETPADH
jgi:diguanylate cyclase (GGDEF)-like protein/PAS domain S-box-containing protein